MNISQALLSAKAKLKKNAIQSFYIDSLLLLSHVINKPKEFVIFNPDFELSTQEISEFESLVNRRQNFEPISHILQKKEFYSRDFIVTKDVLDPRPDSESLIEYVLHNFQKSNINILEVGVGSGCLIITILKEIPNTIGKALDISRPAIEIAKQNRKKHNLEDRLEIIESNLLANIHDNEKFDLIISNPPYIKSNDIANLQKDVKDFEPLSALDGGHDGLDFYRYLAKEAHIHLKPKSSIIMEIGCDQEKEIVEIFKENNFNYIASKKDLSGIVRVLHFTTKN
ncbi:MAG: peptide chain release factor N(5)-glutamine methyltransferase [Rickettsiales bacterium]|nr:peptide chain release factor N(5)-glutamine methyltransferase [Rickettsiales bacterium]